MGVKGSCLCTYVCVCVHILMLLYFSLIQVFHDKLMFTFIVNAVCFCSCCLVGLLSFRLYLWWYNFAKLTAFIWLQSKPSRGCPRNIAQCVVCALMYRTHTDWHHLERSALNSRGFDDLAVSDVHGEFEVVVKDSQIVLFNSVVIKQGPSNWVWWLIHSSFGDLSQIWKSQWVSLEFFLLLFFSLFVSACSSQTE